MLRFVGILLIVISSYLFGKVYARECTALTQELSSLLEFLIHLRARVGDFLEPIAGVAKGYQGRVTDGVLISELKDGKRLGAALSACVDKLPIDEGEREELSRLANAIDLTERDSLLRDLDRIISQLGRLVTEKSERAKGRAKAVKITAIAVGLGISVLLL